MPGPSSRGKCLAVISAGIFGGACSRVSTLSTSGSYWGMFWPTYPSTRLESENILSSLRMCCASIGSVRSLKRLGCAPLTLLQSSLLMPPGRFCWLLKFPKPHSMVASSLLAAQITTHVSPRMCVVSACLSSGHDCRLILARSPPIPEKSSVSPR